MIHKIEEIQHKLTNLTDVAPPVLSLLYVNVYAWSFPISRKKDVFWKYVREHKWTQFFKKGSFLMTMYWLLGKGVYLCDSQECEILEILPFLA